MWKKLLYCFAAMTAVSALSVSLTACNTVQGAGRDVERAGQKVQEEAIEHKPK